MEKPKIDPDKMAQATDLLRQVMSITNRYNDLLKTFTPQEKSVAGGIIFCVRSNWDDVRMVGVMVDREMAGNMIETLAAFYQNPEQFRGLQGSTSIIQPANKGPSQSN